MSLVYVGTNRIPVLIGTLLRDYEALRLRALEVLSNGTLVPTKSSAMPYVQLLAEAQLSCLVARQTEVLYQLQSWMEANESRNIHGTLMSVSKHSNGWWICFLATDIALQMDRIIWEASQTL